MRKLILIFCLLPIFSFAQPLKLKKTQSGILSLGVRTTISTFNGSDPSNYGNGYGGEFRVNVIFMGTNQKALQF